MQSVFTSLTLKPSRCKPAFFPILSAYRLNSHGDRGLSYPSFYLEPAIHLYFHLLSHLPSAHSTAFQLSGSLHCVRCILLAFESVCCVPHYQRLSRNPRSITYTVQFTAKNLCTRRLKSTMASLVSVFTMNPHCASLKYQSIFDSILRLTILSSNFSVWLIRVIVRWSTYFVDSVFFGVGM